jgi:hypothetical protein
MVKNNALLLLFVAIAPLFAVADRNDSLKQLGKLPLILFWLAIEYLMLKFAGENGFFLADAVSSKPGWLRWTIYTGYTGASLWILVVNLCVYLALFRKWQYAAILVIVIVGPILYSYSLPPDPGLRMEPHQGNGEWIPRTAAWISVLILLSAFTKEFIRKK